MAGYQIKPCIECPWRVDVATGRFPPERFVQLASTAYDMSIEQFACHKSPEGAEFGCAGFALAGGTHNLGLRLAIRAGALNLRAMDCEHPLYPNFRAMAVANGVPEDHPALVACRDDQDR